MRARRFRWSRRRVLGCMVAVGFVAASCGGADDDGVGEAQPGRAKQESGDPFLDDEQSGIGAELADARAESPDGLLPADVALDLIASIYGKVPGGTARFDDIRTGDASLAIRAVGARWDELDEDTRAAIEERLGSDGADDETALGASHGRSGARAFTPTGGNGGDPAEEAELLARAERLQGELAQHLGITQQKQIGFQFVPDSTWVGNDEGTLADAAPLRGEVFVTEGEYDVCRIRLNEDYPLTDATLAHEITHCLQFEMTSLEQHFDRPDWIAEGSADWAAATVAGADDTIRGHFVEWQLIPKSLYWVDYAAVGYFWTIETMGLDPWGDIPRMLSSSDRGNDVHHPVLDPKQLVSRMGTGAFMSSADGMPVDGVWDLTPGAVPDEFRTSATVSSSSPIDHVRNQRAFQKTPAAQINVDGDAVDVKLAGEVGAIQEVGGTLETFEGKFEKRFCFEDGDAHIVFFSLASVDPGPVSIKLSVPRDADACQEDPAPSSGCIEGGEVHLDLGNSELIYPVLALPTVGSYPPGACGEVVFEIPGAPLRGKIEDGTAIFRVVVNESQVLNRDYGGQSCDGLEPSCEDVSGGAVFGSYSWSECEEGRAPGPYESGGYIEFETTLTLNGPDEAEIQGYDEAEIQGYGDWYRVDQDLCGPAAAATEREVANTVLAAIETILAGARIELYPVVPTNDR